MLTMHQTRDLLMRQRIQLINAIRGHFAELGIVAPQGTGHPDRVLAHLEVDSEVVEPARQVTGLPPSQLDDLEG